jgi:eukaryotic-like serine/threonine-protein kinase
MALALGDDKLAPSSFFRAGAVQEAYTRDLVSASQDESVRHLQERVALFLKAWTAVSVVGVLIRVVTVFVADAQGALRAAPFYFQLGSVGAGAIPWLLIRTTPRSRRFITVVESFALHVTAACVTLMGASIAAEIGQALEFETHLADTAADVQVAVAMLNNQYSALVVVFLLTGMLVLRAALVPSTPTRTLGLGIGLGVVSSAAYAVGASLHAQPAIAVSVAVGTTAFYASTLVVATVLTHIIHGLREQVRSARKLGQYTLEQKLGEGGMGVVYRASHAMLRRPTAVKLLPPDKIGEQTLERFEREVQLTAQLTHPNTVTVFDYGRTPEGVFYYAMELLDGPNLEQLVEVSGAQPASRVAHLVGHVCGALAEAHGLGLIHRDIKPANILVVQSAGRYDVPKVVDFGLVKDVTAGDDGGLTHDGAITGTPMYLAPEALTEPDSVDARSDLYALGAVAYFLLVGEPVFTGKTIIEICGHHLHSTPPPISERTTAVIDSGLQALVMRCLAKDPSQRPPTAAAMGAALIALDLPPWTAEESARWWASHGDALASQRSAGVVSAEGRTVAIDLTQRG